MIITSRSANVLGCASGSCRIWSLADGYVDMPAALLKEPDGRMIGLPRSLAAKDALVRLSVNCFLVDRAGADRVLIDCGAGGSWDPSLGHLEEAMAEAGIDPSSITIVAITHAHGDHINGVLTPDGRELFANLRRIVIAEDAAARFLAESPLERFRPLLAPVKSGDHLADHLQAVALPGHAPGHMGYRLDTGEENVLFCGDVIHVPAVQFARPELTWGYDDSQPLARATRIKLFQEAAGAHTWLAGAHMGRPGIGRLVEEGQGYAFRPVG
jgi:glyoxylase-like metal-dependent hydrolase (beta-lactamase superfamily II)